MGSVPPRTIAGRLLAIEGAAGHESFLTLLGPRERSLTYSELLAEAREFGGRLASEPGVGPGRTIVIILPHGPQVYVAFVGSLLIGCRPALFAFPSIKHSSEVYFETVGDLVGVAAPAAIIAEEAVASTLGPHLESLGLRATLLTPGDLARRPAGAGEPAPGPDADDVALLQFSSGTTGLKKGVQLTHRQVLAQVDRYAEAIRLDPASDVICSWLPLYHDMGLVACCLLPLLTGTPVVAMSPFDWVRRPRMLLEAITAHAGTLSWLPNFSLPFLADAVGEDELAGLDLSSVRGLINCSEAITDRALRAFDDRFATVGWRPEAHAASYALAENTFAVSSGGMGAPMTRLKRDGRTWVSSGTLLADTQVRIVDGEIAIRSPSLFEGYHGADAPPAPFDDGYFLTGDLGFVEDGELYVTGRKNDLLILRGENHFPQDIEATVSEVEGIAAGRCAAVGRFDERSGTEELVVIAETSQTDESARRTLCAAVAAALASRQSLVTRDLVLAAPGWLRKSTSGKLARAANLRRADAWLAGDEDDGELWRWDGRGPGPDRGDAGDRAVRAPDRELDDTDLRVAGLIADQLKAKGFPAPSTPAEVLDLDLLMSGALDSLAFASLLMFIEVALSVVLRDEEFAFTDRLATGAGIADAVRRAASTPQSLSSPRESDHDAKCRLFAQADQDFDVIVLGSSRSMQLRTEEARRRGLSAFNMSVSGPSIEDYGAILRFLSAPPRRPPKWLLCELHVDLVPFEAPVSAQLLDCRWLVRYVPTVIDPDGALMGLSKRTQIGQQSRRRSSLILDQLRRREADAVRPFGFTAGTGDKRYLDTDALAARMNADQPLNLPDDVLVEKRHLALRCKGGPSFGQERHRSLVGFLKQLATLQPQTLVVFFEPPQHASLARLLTAEIEGYELRRKALIDYISRAPVPTKLLYDARDPATFGGDRADFRDAWHCGGYNGAKLMAWLLDRAEADWA